MRWSRSCCLWKNRTWSLNGAAARFPPPLVVVSAAADASSHLRRLPPDPPLPSRRRLGERKRRGARCCLGERKRSEPRTAALPPLRGSGAPGPGAAAAPMLFCRREDFFETSRGSGGKRTSGRQSQRESPRVSVILGRMDVLIGPSKYSYLQLNQGSFSGYIQLALGFFF
jgi:hypothetical protein